MLIRTALNILSPAGPRGRLSILIFHRVLAERDPLFPGEVDCARFNQLMQWVAAWFNVLPLDEAVERLKKGALPPRAAAITFDDGYADNWLNAAPILLRHGLHASFFIATDFLDGGRMFNDTLIESVRNTQHVELDLTWLGLGVRKTGSVEEKRAVLDVLIPAVKHMPAGEREAAVARVAADSRATLPSDLMLSTEQLRSLRSAGMGIGAHTLSHPILAKLDSAAAYREIADSRDVLEGLLGERVGFFAYPNGKLGRDYLPEHADMVRSIGFDAAVSTNWGASGRNSDLFQLQRFTPWQKARAPFGMRLVRNLLATVP